MLTRDSSANQVQRHAVIVNGVLDLFNECCGAFSQLDYWQYAEKKSEAACYDYPGHYMVDATLDDLSEQLGNGANEELSDICDSYRALYEDDHITMPTVVSDLLKSIDSLASAHEDHDQDVDLSDYLQGLQNLQSMVTNCDIWQELRDIADEITAYADTMEEREESMYSAMATFAICVDDMANWLMAEVGYRRQPDIMTAVADRLLDSDHNADWCYIGADI